MNMFEGMFKKVDRDMCALSPSGIAVKTPSGYKTYNVKTGRIVNCDNAVFHLGEGMFFVVPTSKVKPGDIILRGGKPVCVKKVNKDSIEVINYETTAVETILPERHIFMGNVWFYGKIVSMFGSGASIGGKDSMNKMMKFMMMQSLMGGNGGSGLFPADGGNNMNTLLPLMMMGNGNFFGDMFDGIFDEDEDPAGGDDEAEDGAEA